MFYAKAQILAICFTMTYHLVTSELISAEDLDYLEPSHRSSQYTLLDTRNSDSAPFRGSWLNLVNPVAAGYIFKETREDVVVDGIRSKLARRVEDVIVVVKPTITRPVSLAPFSEPKQTQDIKVTTPAPVVKEVKRAPATRQLRSNPVAPVPQPPTSTSNFATDMVNSHNYYRRMHSAQDVSWDDELAQQAQRVGQVCSFSHDTTGLPYAYGQNLYTFTDTPVPATVVKMWYDEVNDYDFTTGGPKFAGAMIGHFTALVWRKTSKIGCAVQSGCAAANKGSFENLVVCNYAEAGNYQGQYIANVLPRSS